LVGSNVKKEDFYKEMIAKEKYVMDNEID